MRDRSKVEIQMNVGGRVARYLARAADAAGGKVERPASAFFHVFGLARGSHHPSSRNHLRLTGVYPRRRAKHNQGTLNF